MNVDKAGQNNYYWKNCENGEIPYRADSESACQLHAKCAFKFSGMNFNATRLKAYNYLGIQFSCILNINST